MRSILNTGSDLVAEIRCNCKPELLRELFGLRTAEWKYHKMSIEGGTVDIFSDLHNFQYSSFELIPCAAEIVLDQEDTELFITALSLLYRCIEESDTTEMPIELSRQWEHLENKVSEIGNADTLLYWKGICEWYRVK